MDDKKPKGLAVPNPQRRQCTAHRKNGDRCKKPPIRGTTVCGSHGGLAPQVRKKAVERIIAASDLAAARLIEFMNDKKVPYSVRLAATRDLLDRGIGPAAQTLKLGLVSDDPWAELLADIITDDNIFEPVPARPRALPPGRGGGEDDNGPDVQVIDYDTGDVVDAVVVRDYGSPSPPRRNPLTPPKRVREGLGLTDQGQVNVEWSG